MAGKAAKCPKCNAALEILGPEQYRSANIVKRGEPTRHSENSTANRRPLLMDVGRNAIVTLVILSAWIFFFSDLRSEPTVDKLRIAKKREHAASTLSPSSGVSAGSAEINDRDKEVVQATPILEDPPVGESIVAVSTGRASTSPTEDHSERVRPDNQLHSGATQNVDKSVVLVQVGASSGSGFFVDDSGIIATAYHVIEGAESVVVHLPNGVKLE